MPLALQVVVTDENFDEARYLDSQPDVRIAVAAGEFKSGRQHFDLHGRRERRNFELDPRIDAMRSAKMERLRPHLRNDMDCVWIGGRANFLTENLRRQAGIVDTDAVSSHNYDGHALDLIAKYPNGLVLDCGAGSRPIYFENVVNFEIKSYASTDVLGVGESLPFADGTFDGVISVAVLEHVRDPFRCADEIARVLKPGGRLYCAVPFLQPYHGYPHHYFNATHQGIARLFEDNLTVEAVRVIDSMHPIWALQWILASWSAGLPKEARKAFGKMTVKDLLHAPLDQLAAPHCNLLPEEKLFELACGTVLTARKPASGKRS